MVLIIILAALVAYNLACLVECTIFDKPDREPNWIIYWYVVHKMEAREE